MGEFPLVGIVLILDQAKIQLGTYRGVLRVLQSTEGRSACEKETVRRDELGAIGKSNRDNGNFARWKMEAACQVLFV